MTTTEITTAIADSSRDDILATRQELEALDPAADAIVESTNGEMHKLTGHGRDLTAAQAIQHIGVQLAQLDAATAQQFVGALRSYDATDTEITQLADTDLTDCIDTDALAHERLAALRGVPSL